MLILGKGRDIFSWCCCGCLVSGVWWLLLLMGWLLLLLVITSDGYYFWWLLLLMVITSPRHCVQFWVLLILGKGWDILSWSCCGCLVSGGYHFWLLLLMIITSDGYYFYQTLCSVLIVHFYAWWVGSHPYCDLQGLGPAMVGHPIAASPHTGLSMRGEDWPYTPIIHHLYHSMSESVYAFWVTR